MPRLHRWVIHNNTPGIVTLPAIIESHNPTMPPCGLRHSQSTCVPSTLPPAIFTPIPSGPRTPPHDLWHSQGTRVPQTLPLATFTPIPSGAQQRIITQQEIHVLTIQEQVLISTIHTPRRLLRTSAKPLPIKFQHFASPVVHPITNNPTVEDTETYQQFVLAAVHGSLIRQCPITPKVHAMLRHVK